MPSLPLNSPQAFAVGMFVDAARGFCAWCEEPPSNLGVESQAAAWISRLYAAALDLPEVSPESANGIPDIPPHALQRATTKLAPFNGWYYREYFDPHPLLNDESGMGDVGDDLLDIYKDIRAGLMLFEQGQTAEALWHWAFLHRVHWGRHAVGALFALHCMSIAQKA